MTTTSPKPLPQLVDIGINLTHKSFQKDRDAVVQRAREQANVGALVLTGCSVSGSIEAQSYCADTVIPGVQLYCTAGVHPHDAKNCDESTIDTLKNLVTQGRVVAIGECGLDYNRNFSPPEVQRIWFEKQLQLASELQLPVFLHERDSFDDFFFLLKQYHEKIPAAVVHCFTGTQEHLEAYLSLPNCSIGITGWICDERRGNHLQELVPTIPDDRLMIETDAPFLFPRDLPKERRKKGSRRNEPAFLDHVCQALATCRLQSTEHVARITTENAVRFFGLPSSLVEEGEGAKSSVA